MTVFNGIDQSCIISGLAPAGLDPDRQKVVISLGATIANQPQHHVLDARPGGTATINIGSNGVTAFASGNVGNLEVNGAPGDAFGGATSSIGFLFSSALSHNGSFSLFVDNVGSNPNLEINVTQIEILSGNGETTPIHRFTLPASPTSLIINDEVGTAVLLLVNFPIQSETIDSVSALTIGETGTYTKSGFGPITGLFITDPFLNTQIIPPDEADIAVPALADEQNALITGNIDFSATDGTAADSAPTTLSVPAGFSSVKLQPGFITTNLSFLFNYGGIPAVGDEFIYDSAEGTLFPDGNWTLPAAGNMTIYATDETDGYRQSFLLIAGPSTTPEGDFGLDPIDSESINNENIQLS